MRVRAFDPRKIASANKVTREAERAGALQVRGEFAPFLLWAGRLRPGRILEIGLGAGGSLQAFCKIARDDATLVNVDMPAGPFPGVSEESALERIRGYARPEQTLHLIRGDSHDEATIAETRRCFDGPIDVLFIDGDHRYEGVKADFENYAPLVRDGGLIGFHDIVDGPADEVGGVPDFWRDLKATGVRFLELVDDYRVGGSCGIGVIKKSSH